MKVIVGSDNPVKINAVKRAFEKYFDNVEVEGIAVNSGVSKQPFSAEESYQGAYTRAKKALKKGGSFGVGIEGGIEKFSFGNTTSGFVVILGKNGEKGFGTSARMWLPEKFMEGIEKENKEIGDLVDEVTGVKDSKRKQGMFGVFTNNVVDRTHEYMEGVIFALSAIVNPEYYE